MSTGLFSSASFSKPESSGVQKTTSLESAQDRPTLSPPKATFSFGSSQAPSSLGLFAPAKPTSEKFGATDPSNPSAFSATPSLETPNDNQNEATMEKTKKPLFGRTLGNSQPAEPQPMNDKPIFAPSSVTKTSEVAPVANDDSVLSPPESSVQTRPSTQLLSSDSAPKRPVYTKSPGRIPTFINGEGYKEFDNNYRLRALNREFQRRLASLDPERQDFENIIRHYAAARSSIGADIGLYQRTIAGAKRKHDSNDEAEEQVPPQYKKVKPSEGLATGPTPLAPQQTLFGASPHPGAQSSSATSSNPSKATSMFNDMIHKSPGKAPNFTTTAPKTTTAAPTSLFAPVQSSAASGHHENVSSPPGPVDDVGKSTANTSSSSQPLPSTTPVKPPPFAAPSFPVVAGSNAFAAFASTAAKTEKKRKAERLLDYDSDEDSQAEGRREIEEEERAKRAKYSAIAKTGFTPSFGSQPASSSASKSPSKSGFKPVFGTNSNEKIPKSSPTKLKRNSPFESTSEEDEQEAEADDEETTEEKDADFVPDEEGSSEESEEAEDGEEDLQEDEVDEGTESDHVDRQAEIDANPNKGKSLFDRVEPNPEKAADVPVNGDKVFSKNSEPSFGFSRSDDQSQGKNSFKPNAWATQFGKPGSETTTFAPTPQSTFKPSGTFSFVPTPPTGTGTPASGASVLSGGLTAGSYSKFDGMFGSRPTTPNPPELESPAPTSGPKNHTWTPGSAIKFDRDTESVPSISFTGPSPQKQNLFGNSSAATVDGKLDAFKSINNTDRMRNILTAKSGALVPEASSRGTSPGLTDNESVATDVSEAMPPEPQSSFVDSRSGEENEECLFEAKSKALRFISEQMAPRVKGGVANNWKTEGLGVLRLLKHKDTAKCRILLRAEPGGNIIVNANLLPNMEYSSTDQGKSGALKGTLYNDREKWLERWVFKLKTKEMADELEGLMKANQAN
jgi:hypothetical protein